MIAQYGLKAMVTLNGEKILDDVVRAYHAACHRHGRQAARRGHDWGAGIYLAGSQDEAIRRLEPAHDERYKWFAPFGFVRYADEQGRTWGTPGAPATSRRLRDGVKQKAWFCGPPAEVIDGIKSIEAKYPGPRRLHDPLGRGFAARGIQGTVALVRQGRDARVQPKLGASDKPLSALQGREKRWGEGRGLGILAAEKQTDGGAPWRSRTI